MIEDYDFSCGNDFNWVKIALGNDNYHTIRVQAEFAKTIDFSGDLRNLDEIIIDRCPKFTQILWPDNTRFIKRLKIGNSSALTYLDLSTLVNLEELSIINCKKLAKINGLGEHLKLINIQGCSISQLDFSSSKEIKNFILKTQESNLKVNCRNCDFLQSAIIHVEGILNIEKEDDNSKENSVKSEFIFAECSNLKTLKITAEYVPVDLDIRGCSNLKTSLFSFGEGVKITGELMPDQANTGIDFENKAIEIENYIITSKKNALKMPQNPDDVETIIQENGSFGKKNRFCLVKLQLLMRSKRNGYVYDQDEYVIKSSLEIENYTIASKKNAFKMSQDPDDVERIIQENRKKNRSPVKLPLLMRSKKNGYLYDQEEYVIKSSNVAIGIVNLINPFSRNPYQERAVSPQQKGGWLLGYIENLDKIHSVRENESFIKDNPSGFSFIKNPFSENFYPTINKDNQFNNLKNHNFYFFYKQNKINNLLQKKSSDKLALYFKNKNQLYKYIYLNDYYPFFYDINISDYEKYILSVTKNYSKNEESNAQLINSQNIDLTPKISTVKPEVVMGIEENNLSLDMETQEEIISQDVLVDTEKAKKELTTYDAPESNLSALDERREPGDFTDSDKVKREERPLTEEAGLATYEDREPNLSILGINEIPSFQDEFFRVKKLCSEAGCLPSESVLATYEKDGSRLDAFDLSVTGSKEMDYEYHFVRALIDSKSLGLGDSTEDFLAEFNSRLRSSLRDLSLLSQSGDLIEIEKVKAEAESLIVEPKLTSYEDETTFLSALEIKEAFNFPESVTGTEKKGLETEYLSAEPVHDDSRFRSSLRDVSLLSQSGDLIEIEKVKAEAESLIAEPKLTSYEDETTFLSALEIKEANSPESVTGTEKKGLETEYLSAEPVHDDSRFRSSLRNLSLLSQGDDLIEIEKVKAEAESLIAEPKLTSYEDETTFLSALEIKEAFNFPESVTGTEKKGLETEYLSAEPVHDDSRFRSSLRDVSLLSQGGDLMEIEKVKAEVESLIVEPKLTRYEDETTFLSALEITEPFNSPESVADTEKKGLETEYLSAEPVHDDYEYHVVRALIDLKPQELEYSIEGFLEEFNSRFRRSGDLIEIEKVKAEAESLIVEPKLASYENETTFLSALEIREPFNSVADTEKKGLETEYLSAEPVHDDYEYHVVRALIDLKPQELEYSTEGFLEEFNSRFRRSGDLIEIEKVKAEAESLIVEPKLTHYENETTFLSALEITEPFNSPESVADTEKKGLETEYLSAEPVHDDYEYHVVRALIDLKPQELEYSTEGFLEEFNSRFRRSGDLIEIEKVKAEAESLIVEPKLTHYENETTFLSALEITEPFNSPESVTGTEEKRLETEYLSAEYVLGDQYSESGSDDEFARLKDLLVECDLVDEVMNNETGTLLQYIREKLRSSQSEETSSEDYGLESAEVTANRHPEDLLIFRRSLANARDDGLLNLMAVSAEVREDSLSDELDNSVPEYTFDDQETALSFDVETYQYSESGSDDEFARVKDLLVECDLIDEVMNDETGTLLQYIREKLRSSQSEETSSEDYGLESAEVREDSLSDELDNSVPEYTFDDQETALSFDVETYQYSESGSDDEFARLKDLLVECDLVDEVMNDETGTLLQYIREKLRSSQSEETSSEDYGLESAEVTANRHPEELATKDLLIFRRSLANARDDGLLNLMAVSAEVREDSLSDELDNSVPEYTFDDQETALSFDVEAYQYSESGSDDEFARLKDLLVECDLVDEVMNDETGTLLQYIREKLRSSQSEETSSEDYGLESAEVTANRHPEELATKDLLIFRRSLANARDDGLLNLMAVSAEVREDSLSDELDNSVPEYTFDDQETALSFDVEAYQYSESGSDDEFARLKDLLVECDLVDEVMNDETGTLLQYIREKLRSSQSEETSSEDYGLESAEVTANRHPEELATKDLLIFRRSLANARDDGLLNLMAVSAEVREDSLSDELDNSVPEYTFDDQETALSFDVETYQYSESGSDDEFARLKELLVECDLVDEVMNDETGTLLQYIREKLRSSQSEETSSEDYGLESAEVTANRHPEELATKDLLIFRRSLANARDDGLLNLMAVSAEVREDSLSDELDNSVPEYTFDDQETALSFDVETYQYSESGSDDEFARLKELLVECDLLDEVMNDETGTLLQYIREKLRSSQREESEERDMLFPEGEISTTDSACFATLNQLSSKPDLEINLKRIDQKNTKRLLRFFDTQTKLDIKAWEKDKIYTFEDGTEFTFKNDVFQRARKEGHEGVRYEAVSNKALLGEGAFGKVRRIKGTIALDADQEVINFKKRGKDGKRRVVKVQKHSEFANPLSHFQKGFAFAKRAAHLAIKEPTVVENSLISQTSYTVMDEISGRELFAIITDDYGGVDVLSTAECIELTKALLLALKEQVRDKGLIHRDIKPENIMVDLGPPILVKIIDYDLSIETPDGHLAGTEGYYAPEVESDPMSTSAKSDVYSMARVIALIWRVHSPTYYSENYSYTPTRYTSKDMLAGLFNGIYDLSEADQLSIEKTLTGMLSIDPNQRFSVDEAIVSFAAVGREKLLDEDCTLFMNALGTMADQIGDLEQSESGSDDEFARLKDLLVECDLLDEVMNDETGTLLQYMLEKLRSSQTEETGSENYELDSTGIWEDRVLSQKVF